MKSCRMIGKYSVPRNLRAFMLAAATITLLAPAVSAQTSAPATRDPNRTYGSAEITGEFRENGSCQVFADGVAAFQAIDSAQTTYIRGATINLAPAGFDAHEIWCAAKSPDQPMLPLAATDRVFVVMLYAPTGKLAEPRNYEIRLGLPTQETAPYRAGAALFGMSQQKFNDTLPVRTGLLYLAGTRGTVAITRVAEDGIVGTFSIHGQPAFTM